MTSIENRQDFVFIFDVQDGNPNGDPDAGNMPRVDPETNQGLVTDVCIKRKVRNYVQIAAAGREGMDIFVKEKAVLNTVIEQAFKDIGVKPDKKAKGEDVEKGRREMCRRFFDVRTFGAVMTTGLNAGQVRGPVQLTFSRSVDPVFVAEHAITRMAVATEKEAQSQGGDNRTMGRKNTVPYGLYVGYGFVSPHLAEQTGFNQADLDLFFEAMARGLEHDRSAARGLMTMRELIVFRHGSKLGSAPARRLFDLVRTRRLDPGRPARSFADYAIRVDEAAIPAGVRLERRAP
jgi:CRISPR-associated protein Csd2